MTFTVEVQEFKPLHSGTLLGFCRVVIRELGFTIHDVTVHQKGAQRWAGLPGKPQINRDGTARKGENGKTLYMPVLEIADKKIRDAFSKRVCDAVERSHPDVFTIDVPAEDMTW